MDRAGITTVELEKLKIGAEMVLSPDLLDAQVNFVQDYMMGVIRAQVRGFVWAEKESAKRQEVKYPRDWWQAFKERWFPKWLLDRYPVDYHNVVIDVRAIYPTFKQQVPKHQPVLYIQRYDGFDSDYWKDIND